VVLAELAPHRLGSSFESLLSLPVDTMLSSRKVLLLALLPNGLASFSFLSSSISFYWGLE
jgi:hypothetical protein